eukprot:SM000202S05890  [mRNA]  locus=s202:104477:109090:+ [translate_table: standard]
MKSTGSSREYRGRPTRGQLVVITLLVILAPLNLYLLLNGNRQSAIRSHLRDELDAVLAKKEKADAFSSKEISRLDEELKSTKTSLDVVSNSAHSHQRAAEDAKVALQTAELEAEQLRQEVSLLKNQSSALRRPSDQVVQQLLALWEASTFLDLRAEDDQALPTRADGLPVFVPHPHHLQDCKRMKEMQDAQDFRQQSRSRPIWSVWGGQLAFAMGKTSLGPDDWVEASEDVLGAGDRVILGPYPPWVKGSDEDNLVFTRRAQRDLWLTQHPPDCYDPRVKLLVFPITRGNSDDMGNGATVNMLSGAWYYAMQQQRVFVIHDNEKANHTGCTGKDKLRWSCYFAPETSPECQARVDALPQDLFEDTNYQNIEYNETFFILKDKGSIWRPGVPYIWGEPYRDLHPTVEMFGKMVRETNVDWHRWWFAQVTQYLTRYPSERLCLLLNRARHAAFGMEAALDAAAGLPAGWPEVDAPVVGEAEELVWRLADPWMPPIISVHVRQGDKSQEMRIAEFDEYMVLANRIRRRYPHVKSIWLSTEMQSVVDEALQHEDWKVYFTNTSRQAHDGESITKYEHSIIGRQASQENAWVNLVIAADCNYFVGALGSTWSIMIDNLRVTSGKQMSAFLTVNGDRFW